MSVHGRYIKKMLMVAFINVIESKTMIFNIFIYFVNLFYNVIIYMMIEKKIIR